MEGKKVSMRPYITGKNLEKLERIQKHLNNGPNVINGESERWTKSAVYEHLINTAIENFDLGRD